MHLKKNPPVEIDPANPFFGDALDHQGSIRILTDLIGTITQPFVITIEAPWGSGKTTFIRRWQAHLRWQKHLCLYFNAWENDFVTDPLVAFIAELKAVMKQGEVEAATGRKLKAGFEKLQQIGGKLAKKGGPLLAKLALMKALGSEGAKELMDAVGDAADEELADLLSESVQNKIESYEEEKTSMEGFRKTLKDLVKTATSAHDGAKQVIFFVDELDRCRPEFAMSLLERMKHLFSVEGIVFVLALDRGQLRNTVRHLYGMNAEADAYLRRFIDLAYKLPKPSNKSFAQLLYDRFGMDGLFALRKDGGLEKKRLLPAFFETATWLNLDLRTQEQCFTRLNAIARLWRQDQYLPTDALSILVGLKVGNPVLFESLRSGEASLEGLGPKGVLEFQEFSQTVVTVLQVCFLSEDAFAKKAQAIRDRLNQAGAQTTHDVASFSHFSMYRTELLRLIEFSYRVE